MYIYSVVVTYPTSNQGDVSSSPICGNMFFFQDLFHIYISLRSWRSCEKAENSMRRIQKEEKNWMEGGGGGEEKSFQR